MKNENKKLLESFSKIALGELIKPIKKKIVWIETGGAEDRTYFKNCFNIGSEELTLYSDEMQWNVDWQWTFDTEVKISKDRKVLQIEECELSFMVGGLYKF